MPPADKDKALIDKVVLSIADGNTLESTANAVKLSSYQLRMLLKKPAALAALNSETEYRLKISRAKAINVIENLLSSKTATDKIRLDAAKAILTYGAGDSSAATVQDLTDAQLHELGQRLAQEQGDRALTLDGKTGKPVSG